MRDSAATLSTWLFPVGVQQQEQAQRTEFRKTKAQ